jgi:hypothetical protein
MCDILLEINFNYEKEAPCILVDCYKVSEKSASYVSFLEVADNRFL